MYQIGPGSGNLIIYLPSTGQLARSAAHSSFKCEERYNVTRVGVEHLLVSSICGTSNNLVWVIATQVLDVRQHNIGRLPLKFVILTTALGGDMCRYASVNDDVLLACVRVNVETSDHEKAMAVVQFVRQTSQLSMQCRQGECRLSDVTERQAKRCAQGQFMSLMMLVTQPARTLKVSKCLIDFSQLVCTQDIGPIICLR